MYMRVALQKYSFRSCSHKLGLQMLLKLDVSRFSRCHTPFFYYRSKLCLKTALLYAIKLQVALRYYTSQHLSFRGT